MGASSNSDAPVVLTTRQKVAGAIHASGVSVPIDQISTLVDAIVNVLEPAPVAEAPAAQPEQGA